MYKLMFILSAFVVSTLSYAGNVNLRTTLAPPYQVKEGANLSGTSIDALECIFKSTGHSYKADVVPWARALSDLKEGTADGFFTSMAMDDFDRVGSLSSPLALEKWYWFFKDKSLANKPDFQSGLNIGAIRASSNSAWLKANKYQVNKEVNRNEQLIQLLDSGRIDAILFDQKTFTEEASKLGFKDDQFASKFSRYTPLGVYFTRPFLAANSGFLDAFNDKVSDCVPEAITLNAQEETKLNDIASQKIKQWLFDDQVISKIKAQNIAHADLNNDQIISLDKQWRKESKSDAKPLIDKVLSNPLSTYLKGVKAKSKGLYAEIFVMDNKGLNVGQSDVTSDYWQGDEGKFKKSFGKGKDTIFVDAIEYDGSSKKFQSQISVAIHDPATNEVIGAVTVGVDVEKALSAE